MSHEIKGRKLNTQLWNLTTGFSNMSVCKKIFLELKRPRYIRTQDDGDDDDVIKSHSNSIR